MFATVIAITKDLPDVEGDRKYNIDTLATRFGARTISFVGKSCNETCDLSCLLHCTCIKCPFSLLVAALQPHFAPWLFDMCPYLCFQNPGSAQSTICDTAIVSPMSARCCFATLCTTQANGCVLMCRRWLTLSKLCGCNHLGHQNAWILQGSSNDRGACSPCTCPCVANCQIGVGTVHRACHSGVLSIHLEPILFRVPSVAISVSSRQLRQQRETDALAGIWTVGQ